MSKHVPPPQGEPVETPMAGLEAQQRERESALHELRKLRKVASAEIDRLIDFLDASDLDPDLEDDADREPSLCGITADGANLPNAGLLDEDLEQEADDEPSLAFIERHPSRFTGTDTIGSQVTESLCAGLGGDLEDEHDGCEPSEDDEPSLGLLDAQIDQTRIAVAAGTLGPDAEHDTCDDEPSLGWTVDGCVSSTDRRLCDVEA